MMFFNTTDSARAQRTGALTFANADLLANFVLASDAPLVFDPARLRAQLLAYRIDGSPLFDEVRDREALAQVVERAATWWSSNTTSLLERSRGAVPYTDDNLGDEMNLLEGPI